MGMEFFSDPLKNGFVVVVSVEWGTGKILTIGLLHNRKAVKAIRSNSKQVLESLNEFYGDISELERAMLWNVGVAKTGFGSFKGTRGKYLAKCKADLKNKFLTPDAKEDIEGTIKAIEATIRNDIYVKLQRKEFSSIRKKHVAQLLEIADYKCQECGKRDNLTVDHVIPITRGGKNELNNFQILCRSCNASKNNKLPHEWKAEQDHNELTKYWR